MTNNDLNWRYNYLARSLGVYDVHSGCNPSKPLTEDQVMTHCWKCRYQVSTGAYKGIEGVIGTGGWRRTSGDVIGIRLCKDCAKMRVSRARATHEQLKEWLNYKGVNEVFADMWAINLSSGERAKLPEHPGRQEALKKALLHTVLGWPELQREIFQEFPVSVVANKKPQKKQCEDVKVIHTALVNKGGQVVATPPIINTVEVAEQIQICNTVTSANPNFEAVERLLQQLSN